MIEKQVRDYFNLKGDLKSYNHYVEYLDKLHSIKDKIFNQVLSHLDCSFDDLSIVLSSDDLHFLREFKNEKV